MKKYIKILFILATASLITSCNDTPDETEYSVPISFGLADLYGSSSAMSIFEHWVERSYYLAPDNRLEYKDNTYGISTTPLTPEEKISLNIEPNNDIYRLPCYKLLKNGADSDILLFCLDDQNPMKRVIYAYSKSLKDYFIAYELSSNDNYVFRNEYVGISNINDLHICKENICFYRSSRCFSFNFRENFCFISIFFSVSMDVWIEAFGQLESRYGRLGVKDGIVPPNNLIRTDVIECSLGAAGDKYTEWYRNCYIPYDRQILIEEYNNLFSEIQPK